MENLNRHKTHTPKHHLVSKMCFLLFLALLFPLHTKCKAYYAFIGGNVQSITIFILNLTIINFLKVSY
jgi:hypothetical protein